MIKKNAWFGPRFSDRFVGNLLKGQTVGVIGAGRIGSAYARMMVIPNYLIYKLSVSKLYVNSLDWVEFVGFLMDKLLSSLLQQ